jgi:hypothetical protein
MSKRNVVKRAMGIDKNIIGENVLREMNPADRKKYFPGQLTMPESHDKADSRLEKELHNDFINFLHLHDLDFCHPRGDKKSTIAVGRSDFLVWHKTFICFVEFKASWGRLSDAQKAFIARQEAKGTPILVTKSLVEAMNFVTTHLLLPWTDPQNAMEESDSNTIAPRVAAPS